MYIYDKAHELAKALKESPEYNNYKELKDKVFENETDKQLVAKYKKLQFEMQTQYLSGQTPKEETQEEFKKLAEVLQFNKDIAAFLSAEYMINQIVGDVYKIIGDAAELDLSFMA